MKYVCYPHCWILESGNWQACFLVGKKTHVMFCNVLHRVLSMTALLLAWWLLACSSVACGPWSFRWISAKSPPPEALFANPLLLSPLHNDVAPQMNVLFTKYWSKNTAWRFFKNTYTTVTCPLKTDHVRKKRLVFQSHSFSADFLFVFGGVRFRIA